MWRVTNTSFTQQECLRKALEYSWLAENSRSEAAAAYAFYQARYWRSLALVGRTGESDLDCEGTPVRLDNPASDGMNAC
ncbi:hypothetical protein [Mesorhizobium loti]|uniref:hypothetical protein n=1 Tax=Rhizobium loti TaxID=381 RepID=UPI001268FDA8|nr:hypothetical protein [Mesorhizobium loti]